MASPWFIRAFGATHPDIEVELIRTTWNDQVATRRSRLIHEFTALAPNASWTP